VSVGCPGTGDISQAVDRARQYVYQEFEACDDGNGIGLARSANGGKSYTRPVALPGSDGGWDPWLAVAPDGVLYAAFMDTLGNQTYPVIDVSHDHGRTFRAEYSLRPAHGTNWGDAEYLAVGPNGTLYVAWDYGPSDPEISFSTDGGREWSAPARATPDRKNVPHITEVAGAGPGKAYVAWLSSSDPRGYALYLRAFSISASRDGRWLSAAVRISRKFGNPDDFPGDTFGIATSSPAALAVSWGSAVPGSRGNASVSAVPITVLTR